MTDIQLLRPSGLVESPAFSHVAIVPPGATTVLVEVSAVAAVTRPGTS
jgi:hypothetical protein